MIQEDNEGNGGKKIAFEVNSKTYSTAEKIADTRDESVERFAKKSFHEAVNHHEAKEILKSACEDGKLSENSHICKTFQRKEEEHRSVY